MKTISIANQKGGVGKTTHALHLAEALVDSGYSVLFLDVDTQANSSKFLAKYSCKIPCSTFFTEEPDLSNLKEYLENDLILVSADAKLAELSGKTVQDFKNLFDNLQGIGDYFDYCIIDTPPALNFILKSVVFGSDYSLVVMELKQWSIDGAINMLKTIIGMGLEKEKFLQHSCKFLGIIVNKYDKSDKSQPKAKSEFEQNPQISKFLIAHNNQTLCISLKNIIEHSLNNAVPVWKYNLLPVKKSTAAIEATKEFTKLYQTIFPLIEADYLNLATTKE